MTSAAAADHPYISSSFIFKTNLGKFVAHPRPDTIRKDCEEKSDL